MIVRVHAALKDSGVGGPIKEPRRDAQRTDPVTSGPSSTNLVSLTNPRHQHAPANMQTGDDLASLDEKLDGLVRNIRATAATSVAAMSAFGGKADIGWTRVNVRFDPKRTCELHPELMSAAARVC
jgi:hypothetical protein